MRELQRGLGNMLCPPPPVSPAANQAGISSSQPKNSSPVMFCWLPNTSTGREGWGLVIAKMLLNWLLRLPSAAQYP